MTTAADVVNRALELIASQERVTGSYPAFDSTVAGNAAAVVYQPAVEMLLRRLDPAFARSLYTLSPQAATTLIAASKWTYEYTYPSIALRVRQIRPPANGYDANNPQPIRATVASDPLSAGGPAKVILSNQVNAIAVITTGNAGVGQEAFWDSGFQEAVARQLANPLSMALAGRPDFARELLEEAERAAAAADLVDEM